MAKLTEEQLLRKELQTTIAKAVQLVTMNLSRRMKNEVEPDLLSEFDKAVASGEPFHYDLGEAVEEVMRRITKPNRKALR